MKLARVVLALAAVALVVGQYTGAFSVLSIQGLRERRVELVQLAEQYPSGAPLAYVGLFIALVSTSLPGGTALTLAAGMLFPQPLATVVAVSGASVGAACCFNLVRSALGEPLRKRLTSFGMIGTLESRLQASGAIYLVIMRLIPVFPFWFCNAAPAILGVPFATFSLTTALAIIPGSYLYTVAGAALVRAADNETVTAYTLLVDTVLDPEMRVPIGILLSWIALLLLIQWFVTRSRAPLAATATLPHRHDHVQ